MRRSDTFFNDLWFPAYIGMVSSMFGISSKFGSGGKIESAAHKLGELSSKFQIWDI